MISKGDSDWARIMEYGTGIESENYGILNFGANKIRFLNPGEPLEQKNSSARVGARFSAVFSYTCFRI